MITGRVVNFTIPIPLNFLFDKGTKAFVRPTFTWPRIFETASVLRLINDDYIYQWPVSFKSAFIFKHKEDHDGLDKVNIILDEPMPIPEEVAAFDLSKFEDRFRVVALGDSITQCSRWERAQRWTGILEAKLGSTCIVINAGIGGTSSSLGLLRWERDVAPIRPHSAVINFLLNDSHIRHYECRSSYCVQCTRDRMDSNLRIMVERSRAMGAVPIFWTPPPVPDFPEGFKSPTHFAIQKELLEHYLLCVERLAEDLKVPLANFWRTFPDMVKEYPGPYFDRPDGYHSNALSQPIIAEGITKLVKPILEAWLSARQSKV